MPPSDGACDILISSHCGSRSNLRRGFRPAATAPAPLKQKAPREAGLGPVRSGDGSGAEQLAYQRTKAPRQHPLSRSISSDDVKSPPYRAVKCRCDYRRASGNPRDDIFTFWFHRPEPFDLPRDRRSRPVETTYRAGSSRLGTPYSNANDRPIFQSLSYRCWPAAAA